MWIEVFQCFPNEKLGGGMYFTVIFAFCKLLAHKKGKNLDFMGKKLFAFTQVWHGLGVWRMVFLLLLFLQDRKSTFLLTVIKTLAQIPRKKRLCALPRTFQLTILEVRESRAKNPSFFDGVHSASAGAQYVTAVHVQLLLFPCVLA